MKARIRKMGTPSFRGSIDAVIFSRAWCRKSSLSITKWMRDRGKVHFPMWRFTQRFHMRTYLKFRNET